MCITLWERLLGANRWMHDNDIGTFDVDAFQGLISLQTL